MATTRRATRRKAGQRIRTGDITPRETIPRLRPSAIGFQAKSHHGHRLQVERVSALQGVDLGARARTPRVRVFRYRTQRPPPHLRRQLRIQALCLLVLSPCPVPLQAPALLSPKVRSVTSLRAVYRLLLQPRSLTHSLLLRLGGTFRTQTNQHQPLTLALSLIPLLLRQPGNEMFRTQTSWHLLLTRALFLIPLRPLRRGKERLRRQTLQLQLRILVPFPTRLPLHRLGNGTFKRQTFRKQMVRLLPPIPVPFPTRLLLRRLGSETSRIFQLLPLIPARFLILSLRLRHGRGMHRKRTLQLLRPILALFLTRSPLLRRGNYFTALARLSGGLRVSYRSNG